MWKTLKVFPKSRCPSCMDWWWVRHWNPSFCWVKVGLTSRTCLCGTCQQLRQHRLGLWHAPSSSRPLSWVQICQSLIRQPTEWPFLKTDRRVHGTSPQCSLWWSSLWFCAGWTLTSFEVGQHSSFDDSHKSQVDRLHLSLLRHSIFDRRSNSLILGETEVFRAGLYVECGEWLALFLGFGALLLTGRVRCNWQIQRALCAIFDLSSESATLYSSSHQSWCCWWSGKVLTPASLFRSGHNRLQMTTKALRVSCAWIIFAGYPFEFKN